MKKHSSVPTHTKGPWKLRYDEGEYQGSFEIRMASAIRNPGMYTSIHLIELYEGVWPEDAEFAEAQANAQLIAVAPELLAALKALYDETADYIKINHLGEVHHNRSMQLAQSAIAKAEGRQ